MNRPCYNKLLQSIQLLKLKGNVQFFQKVTFQPLMDFKQNHYGSIVLWKHSHKNGNIVWKHGPYNVFHSIMLHFHGWSLSKGVQKNKNGFRQGRFLYEDDLDAVLAIIDADMFENDEDMESEIVTCIKNLPSRENCSFKWEFCPKVCLSKAGLSRHEKAKHQQHSTHDSVSHSDSGSSRSKLELTGFSLMYQKSAQKSSTDEFYPDNVTEEFKNFNASLDDLMPYKLILPVVNSFSGDTDIDFTHKYTSFSVKQKIIKISAMTVA